VTELLHATGRARPSSGARLSMKHVSKRFPGTRALDDVDLDLLEGEVHALLGMNGSGKSTLIKILAGYHRPEAGAEVVVGGAALQFGHPRHSAAAGLCFIHQDLGLIPTLSVAENLELTGRYPARWWLSERAERAAAQRVLDSYNIPADPGTPVGSLRPAQQTLLAIARAVESGLGKGGLLVLDEPTASLPPGEVQELFALLAELKGRGVTILYVTHRLPEVFEIADRVTVLREGRRVKTRPVEGLDHDQLVELILGQALQPAEFAGSGAPGSRLLEVRGLSGGTVLDATLTAHAGQIVGVTGLMGSGYEELLGLIFGGNPRRAGEIVLDGAPLAPGNPRRSIRAGLAFAPADRRRHGAVTQWTLRENVTLPAIPSRSPARWLGERRERREARPWLQRLSVAPDDPERQFASLSGGNQQRVVMARWLRCGARVFLLDEPTFGVDAGAKHAIYTELRKAADAGAGVLIASSDTEELSEVCDRVMVLGHGVVRSELPAACSPEEIFAATLRAARAGDDTPPQEETSHEQ
jgi:ribose transport system ATP-binding protein